jgi:hypothetical protein
MRKMIVACLLIAGCIKLGPLIGVLSAEQLTRLYQVNFDNPDVLVLMRHRAVLFGLLGGFILLSVFKPALRPGAIAAGLISALAFIALVLLTPGYSPVMQKIMIADIVVVIALLAAWAFERAFRQH